MRDSIGRRLTLVFIGLAIGPLLLVGVVLTWESFVTQEQQALNLQRQVAQGVSTRVQAFLDELKNELLFVNHIQGMQGLDRDAQRNTLAGLLSYKDSFESLVLLDKRGQELVRFARSSVTPAELGVHATAEEFVIPQTTGDVYYSSVHFDKVTGEPFVTMAVPLLDLRTGLVDGVLVSEVRLKGIWDLITDLPVSVGQSVYIVDARSRVVAHRNPSVVLRGTTFHVPDHDGIQPGLAGVSPMTSVDKREGFSIRSIINRLTSPNVVLAVDTVRLGKQEFNVIAEQNVAEALALAINTVLITSGLIMAALVISVVLGLVMVRQVVHPIQAMAVTAKAISGGDLSRQVQVTSQDEVGVLAVAFNSMTTQLRQSLESLEQQVTEVKQAEESLRKANETLQALIDYSPLAILMLNLDTRILLWNNTAKKMYGWTAEEIIGQLLPFPLESQREELRTIFERITHGEVITNLEVEHKRKDGSLIWNGVSIAPLRDSKGNIYAAVSMAADITKRKKAEEALQESEQRFRTLAEAAFEGIALTKDGVFIDVNDQMAHMFGYDPNELIGNPVATIAPESRNLVLEVLRSGRLDPYEHVGIRKDGTKFPVEARARGPQTAGGLRITAIRDITERKQTEQKMHQLNAELEQRVDERTAQLEAANKELEAFSYSVSHDLRAPLRAIDGYTRILTEDYEPFLDAEGKRVCAVISEETRRMGRLIDDLLAFSRLSRADLQRAPIDMRTLVHSLFSELTAPEDRERIDFRVQPLPVAVGDATLVRQVWVNLLANAVKFSSKQPRAIIEVGSQEQAGEITYWVRDDGAGFDMQYANKLFGVFQRLHSESEFQGTGVGLAIVQRVIRRHGGRVWAEGQVMRGATFYFTLPGKGA